MLKGGDDSMIVGIKQSIRKAVISLGGVRNRKEEIMRKVKNVSYRILIFLIFLVGTLAFSGSVSAIELAYDDGSCLLSLRFMVRADGPQLVRQRFLLSDFGLSGDYPVGKDVKVRIQGVLSSYSTDFACQSLSFG